MKYIHELEIELGTNAKLPWEYNETLQYPIRASIWPSLFVQPGFSLLKLLKTKEEWNPNLLLTSSRLFVFLASFLCDFIVWKLATYLFRDKKIVYNILLLWMSSFSNWVLMTRTLNNSVETLFLLVLFYVITVKFNKPVDSLYSVFPSVISTVGVFLRPTFVLFAFIPLVNWLYKIIYSVKRPFQCLCLGIISALVAAVLLIISDTLFYREALSLSTLVLTPLNFILYQLDQSNLAIHGIHPRYTHFIINMPLLVGPIYALILFFMAKAMVKRRNPLKLSNTVMALLLIFSLFGISSAPHQEFRFLMPLVPICCLMSGPIFHNLSKNSVTLCIAFHIVYNMIVGLFFSFLHQSTSVLLASYLYNFKSQVQYTDIYLFCSYTFPNFLLASFMPSIPRIHDLGSANIDDIKTFLPQLSQTSALLAPCHLLNEQMVEKSVHFSPVFSGECLPSELRSDLLSFCLLSK